MFSYARGEAPCIPGIRPPAALTEPAKQVPSGRRAPGVAGSAGVGGTQRGGAVVLVACLPCHCGACRGGLPSLSPANPATVVPEGGACLLCRPPTPPLVYFPAPYPPSPLPRWGRGRFFCFLMQGASPLASPALDRLRHLQNLLSKYQAGACPRRCRLGGRWRHPAGACPLCRLLTPPLAFFPAPHPPTPLPLRGRGRFFVFLCKGLRPLHPRH